MSKTIVEIQQSFDKAATQMCQAVDNGALKRYIGIYTLMNGTFPNIISILSEGLYLNPNMKDDDFGEYVAPISEFELENTDISEDNNEDIRTFDNVARIFKLFM